MMRWIVIVAWAVTTAYAAPEQVWARPNILFLLTDDQHWDGYHTSGNDLIHTLNLDCVAARGTRFTLAFVTLALCSPSRAACLTGRYGSPKAEA